MIERVGPGASVSRPVKNTQPPVKGRGLKSSSPSRQTGGAPQAAPGAARPGLASASSAVKTAGGPGAAKDNPAVTPKTDGRPLPSPRQSTGPRTATLAVRRAGALLAGAAHLAGSARPASSGVSATGQNLLYRWSNLSLLIEQTAEQVPTKEFLARHLPQRGHRQFGPRLLNYLRLLQKGDLPRWLQQVFPEPLTRAHQTAVRSVWLQAERIQDLAQQPIYDQAGQQWRLFLLPFLNGHEILQLRLYMPVFKERQQGKRKSPRKQQKTSEDQRFIVEASATAFGPLQLDNWQSSDQIRIVLRSMRLLEEQWQDDIRLIFRRSLSALTMEGEIAFHHVDQFPVQPPVFSEDAGSASLYA